MRLQKLTIDGQPPMVAALDIASTTGFCIGRVGSTPTIGSIRFASAGASHGAILASCFDWFNSFTKEHVIDVLALEALLPISAMRGQRTQAHDLLPFLHGVIRLIAFKRRIFRVEALRAVDIRGHFLGRRDLRRVEAKRAVMARCRALGWSVADTDQADAAATWSCACGHLSPLAALQVTPLFSGA